MKLRYCFLSFGVAALVSMIMCAACEVTDQGALTNGILKVQLTGAPGDYEAVYIDIREVRIKSGKLYYEELAEDEDKKYRDNKGWTTVNDKPVRLNLLEYLNGKTIQVGNEELEAGLYEELRIILGTDNSLVVNGASYQLESPGTQQSGLSLKINAEIRDGETYNLLVDFDAGQSIVETEDGKYLLNPVLSLKMHDETDAAS